MIIACVPSWTLSSMRVDTMFVLFPSTFQNIVMDEGTEMNCVLYIHFKFCHTEMDLVTVVLRAQGSDFS